MDKANTSSPSDLRARLREILQENRDYGAPRLRPLLRREGYTFGSGRLDRLITEVKAELHAEDKAHIKKVSEEALKSSYRAEFIVSSALEGIPRLQRAFRRAIKKAEEIGEQRGRTAALQEASQNQELTNLLNDNKRLDNICTALEKDNVALRDVLRRRKLEKSTQDALIENEKLKTECERLRAENSLLQAQLRENRSSK